MLEGIRRYQYSWQVQVPFAILAIVMAFWGFGAGLFNTVHPIASTRREPRESFCTATTDGSLHTIPSPFT